MADTGPEGLSPLDGNTSDAQRALRRPKTPRIGKTRSVDLRSDAWSVVGMSVLDKALAYANKGMHVFPCKPDKTPLTARGFLDASSDPDEVRRLFADHPDALLAIATGEVSGVVVLDIDTVEGHGVNGFAALKRLGWKIPPTTQVLTPSGGRHFYFKHPGQGERVKSGTIEPGVDLKADGGYVIAPPSIGENGREYKFVGKAKPAPLPQFLTEALSRDKRPATPIAGESIPEGTRNVALTSLAGTMQNRGMGRTVIEAALLTVNASRCEPPLAETEVTGIAASVSRYAPAQPGDPDARAPTPPESPTKNEVPLAGESQEQQPFALGLDEFIREKSNIPPALIGEGDDIVVPALGLGILAGKSGKGKTTLAIDLAFHLASGRDWLGHRVERPLNVLFIENEGPREPFRRKLERKRAVWPHPIEGAIHVHTLAWGQLRLDIEGARTKLRAFVEEQEIDLVIADPLGSLGTRGVGSPDETREFVQFLTEAGLLQATAFLLLHHFRKEGASDELDELSGAWAQHADAVLTLTVQSGNRSRLGYPKLRWGFARPASILSFDPETESFEYVSDETDEVRDYLSELVDLMENHEREWHTPRELAEKKPAGIGAGKDKVSGAIGLAFDEDGELNVENVRDEFTVVSGETVGRPQAKLCVGLRTRVAPEVEQSKFHHYTPTGTRAGSTTAHVRRRRHGD